MCACVCDAPPRPGRKLAQQWHPDNFATGDEKDKKKAEAMFIDIAAAKEVLSDPGTTLGNGEGTGFNWRYGNSRRKGYSIPLHGYQGYL